MPVAIGLTDVVALKIYCRAAEQIGINVLHYECVGRNGTGSTTDQMAIVAESAFASLYKDALCVEAEFRGVGCQLIKPFGPWLEEFSNVFPGDGLAVGDLLPRQVAGIITKRTNAAGRANRGRIYVPFPSEESSDANGVPQAGYVTTIQIIGNQYATNLVVGSLGNDVTMQPTIFHRVSGAVSRVIACTARPRWATQRRRGSYGQSNLSPI